METNVFNFRYHGSLSEDVVRHLDLALLRSFVAVVETGGATRAAERVHLTQAAVSQQIKRLEESLDAPLFDRDRRRLKLTDAGERLLGHARRMLALNDEVWSMMTAPDFVGEVRLGVPHDLADPFMPPVLRKFRQDWPRVRVTLLCTTTLELRAAYARDQIDLFLSTELGTPAGAELLFADALVWVGAEGGDAYLRDPLPVALGNRDCAFRAPVLDALAMAERDWQVAGETPDMTSLKAIVEADLGVSAFLASAMPKGLVAVPATAGLPPLPSFNVNLYPPPAGAPPQAQELARHLRCGLGAVGRAGAEMRFGEAA
jgi:DNA-binding transcriptional LysR family regulator